MGLAGNLRYRQVTLKNSSRPRHVTLLPLISFSARYSGCSSLGTRLCNCSLNSGATSDERNSPTLLAILLSRDLRLSRQAGNVTSELAVETRAGGHFEPRVWQQEAGDFGEARVDVLPHCLQLLVLSLLNLEKHTQRNIESSPLLAVLHR